MDEIWDFGTRLTVGFPEDYMVAPDSEPLESLEDDTPVELGDLSAGAWRFIPVIVSG